MKILDRDDLLTYLELNNIKIVDKLVKKRRGIDFIDRLVNLMNYLLVYNSKEVFVSKFEFINFLGDRNYNLICMILT